MKTPTEKCAICDKVIEVGLNPVFGIANLEMTLNFKTSRGTEFSTEACLCFETHEFKICKACAISSIKKAIE